MTDGTAGNFSGSTSALQTSPTLTVTPGMGVVDILSSVAFALLGSQSVALLTANAPPSVLSLQLSALTFVGFAATYRASLSTWWVVFAPASLLLLLSPIARWELLGAFTYASEMRLALAPGLGFVAGSAMAISRGTKSGAFAATLAARALTVRHELALKDLKALEIDMKEVLQTVTARNESFETVLATTTSPAMTSTMTSRLDSPEFSIDEGLLAEHSDESQVDALTHTEVCRMIALEVERLRAEKRKGLHVSFSAPMEIPFPLAVRANREELETAVRAILAQSVSALGGGSQGVVRVTLRPGLRSVTVSFEDNGRGLHEDMIHSLEAKNLSPRNEGSMKLADLRRLAYANNWKMELATRLGVGSRITLELARVDAFAYGARSQNSLRGSSEAKSVDQDSRRA